MKRPLHFNLEAAICGLKLGERRTVLLVLTEHGALIDVLQVLHDQMEAFMGTLTIRLDDKMERELARLAKLMGRTKSEVARDALRRQLAFPTFRAIGGEE